MPEIKCSTEEQAKISEEINKLLAKGAIRQIVNAALHRKLCVTKLSGRKEGI